LQKPAPSEDEIVFGSREPFAKFFEHSLAQNPERRFASASEMKSYLINSKIG